jgi:hypothetical protein
MDRTQWEEGVMAREGQTDSDQAQQIAYTAEEPESEASRVRGAKPNGAQRRPPSSCGI